MSSRTKSNKAYRRKVDDYPKLTTMSFNQFSLAFKYIFRSCIGSFTRYPVIQTTQGVHNGPNHYSAYTGLHDTSAHRACGSEQQFLTQSTAPYAGKLKKWKQRHENDKRKDEMGGREKKDRSHPHRRNTLSCW